MLRPGVSFIIPFRIYLPELFYDVRIESRQFKVKPQALPPVNIGTGIQVHGANVEFSHDIFGYAGRTLFFVILDNELDISTEAGKRDFAERDKLFIQDAIIAVNRLLEVYRNEDINGIGENSFHVIPVVTTDLSDIRIVPIRDDLSEEKDVCVRIPRIGATGFGSATQRSGKVVTEITKILHDGKIIPIYKELLSSAMNAIWRGQYRLSPIESNTAFEALVSAITTQIDTSASSSSLTNLFDKLVLLESILNQKLASKSLPAISWFSPQKNGWRSLLDPVLVEWKGKCYELRGRVIHEGYSHVTVKEAKEALVAAINAIKYVESAIRKIFE
jgi:hypothetical protein